MWFSSFFASSLESRTLAVTSATRAWNLRDCKPHDPIPRSTSQVDTFSSRCGCATGESTGTEGSEIRMMRQGMHVHGSSGSSHGLGPNSNGLPIVNAAKDRSKTQDVDFLTYFVLGRVSPVLYAASPHRAVAARVSTSEHDTLDKPAPQAHVSSLPPTRHWTERSRRSRLADPPNQRYQAQRSQTCEWHWLLRSKRLMQATLPRL